MVDHSALVLDVESSTTIEELLCMYCEAYRARYGGQICAECLRLMRPYNSQAVPSDPISSLGVLNHSTVVLTSAAYALLNETDTYADSHEEVVAYDSVSYDELASVPLSQVHVNHIGCAPWIVNKSPPPNKMWRTYQCAIFGPPDTEYAGSLMFLRMQLNLCGARALPVHAQFLKPVPHHPMVRQDGRILNQLYWDSQSASTNGAMSIVSTLGYVRRMLARRYSEDDALLVRFDRVSDAPQFWKSRNSCAARKRAQSKHYPGQFDAVWKTAESVLVSRACPPGLVVLVCQYFTRSRDFPSHITSSSASDDNDDN